MVQQFQVLSNFSKSFPEHFKDILNINHTNIYHDRLWYSWKTCNWFEYKPKTSIILDI